MVDLFSKISLDAEYFSVRRIQMEGRKVELPTPPIRASIHCFVFITGGETLVTIGEETYCFKANECASIPAGQVFSVRYFDNTTGFMGRFNDEFLNSNIDGKNVIGSFSILRRWGTHKVCFDAEHSKYIGDIFERLYVESSSKKNKNIIRAYLTTLLTEIEEIHQPNSDAPIQTENDICNKYIELVFKCSKHDVSLSEYAAQLNITQNYLSKIVKRFTGKTPLAWITEAVVLDAKVSLCQTAMTTSEIAFSVGIDDPSYFARLFKKQTGYTPQEYREKKKSQECPL
jgi:AraC-like DNA-binding protein